MKPEPQPIDAEAPPAQADAAIAPAAEPTPQWLRLQKLFRHTLQAGEVNPLLLIVPLYRAEADE